MIVEDHNYFALLARLEKLEAAQHDPEADRYLNGLAWAARVDINELVKNARPLDGARFDPATGEVRPIREAPTPSMMMTRLHENRPFLPRIWRRITDAERLRLRLRSCEEAVALTEFVIADQIEGRPLYQVAASYWLNPSAALLAMLHAFGDGIPCHFTRDQLLAAGMRKTGGAEVPGAGEDSTPVAPDQPRPSDGRSPGQANGAEAEAAAPST